MTSRRRRTADPAVVEKNQLAVRDEPVNEQRIPVGTRRTESVQDQKRVAIADAAISDLCPIDLEFLEGIVGHRRR